MPTHAHGTQTPHARTLHVTHPPHEGSSHAPQRPAPCLAQAGGFTFAAEMDGCNQIKLLKAVAKVGAENNELSRVTLYEEWDSVDSSLQCGVYRADQELLERGLGFDAGSGKLMALQVHRTACAAHVQRMCTACAPRVHRLCTAYAPHVHGVCTLDTRAAHTHTHTRHTPGVYPRRTPTRLACGRGGHMASHSD